MVNEMAILIKDRLKYIRKKLKEYQEQKTLLDKKLKEYQDKRNNLVYRIIDLKDEVIGIDFHITNANIKDKRIKELLEELIEE